MSAERWRASPIVVANSRCFLKSAAQAVTSLVISRRHNRKFQDDFSRDVFNSCYQTALGADRSLTNIADHLPPLAQYTSEVFQMVVVRSLAQFVLGRVLLRYKGGDSRSFCLRGCIGGAQDQGAVLALLIRFMIGGKWEEHMIGQVQLEQNDAEHIAERILTHLAASGLNPRHLVSQCYQGVPALHGCSTGVAVALERKLNQRIPNIHCDHRSLSLVLVDAIQVEPSIRSFVNTSERLNQLLQPYMGRIDRQLKRPLNTLLSDPSGYYHRIRHIVLNFRVLCKLLSDVSEEDGVPEEHRRDAAELLPLVQEKCFYFTGKFVLDLITATELTEMQFAHRLLEAPCVKYLPFEVEVTQAALKSLRSLHDSPLHVAENYTWVAVQADSDSQDEPAPKRRRTSNASSDDACARAAPSTPTLANLLDYDSPSTPSMFDAMPPVPSTAFDTPESSRNSDVAYSESLESLSSYEDNPDFTPAELEDYGVVLLRVLHRAIDDLEIRLPQENMAVVEAICALFPSSPNFLDVDVCLPLLNIAQVCRVSLTNEVKLAKSLLAREIEAYMDLAQACAVVYKHSRAFKALYELYVVALLVGIPASDCETSFPEPIASAGFGEHEASAEIVAYEHVIARGLCLEEFLVFFSRNSAPIYQ